MKKEKADKNTVPGLAKAEDTKYDKYAVDNAMRVLQEAEEIKCDPKMMKLVKGKANKTLKAITSIADLEDEYNDKVGPKMDDDEEEEGGA